jgi:hypothetical protein
MRGLSDRKGDEEPTWLPYWNGRKDPNSELSYGFIVGREDDPCQLSGLQSVAFSNDESEQSKKRPGRASVLLAHSQPSDLKNGPDLFPDFAGRKLRSDERQFAHNLPVMDQLVVPTSPPFVGRCELAVGREALNLQRRWYG